MELSNTNPEGTASPGHPTFLTMSCLYEMRKTWIRLTAYRELILEAQDLGLSPRPSALCKPSICAARVTI